MCWGDCVFVCMPVLLTSVRLRVGSSCPPLWLPLLMLGWPSPTLSSHLSPPHYSFFPPPFVIFLACFSTQQSNIFVFTPSVPTYSYSFISSIFLTSFPFSLPPWGWVQHMSLINFSLLSFISYHHQTEEITDKQNLTESEPDRILFAINVYSGFGRLWQTDLIRLSLPRQTHTHTIWWHIYNTLFTVISLTWISQVTFYICSV